MVSCIVQTIGMILGSMATLLTFAICGMPHWRVSIVAESDDYGMRIGGHWISRWDGLWMTCVRQSHNPMSCQYYSASIPETPDLKVSRILISFAVLTAIFGCINALIGMLFNKCCDKNTRNRNCQLLIAGISYILSGILVLIPVTLTAVNILREVCFSYCKSVQQQEIGEAVMLGWPTILFFFIGGSIFCWYHPCVCKDRSFISPGNEHQPEPELCPEQDPLTRERRIFKANCRKNDGIMI